MKGEEGNWRQLNEIEGRWRQMNGNEGIWTNTNMEAYEGK